MTVGPPAVGLLVLDDRARPGFASVAGGRFALTVLAVIGLTVVAPTRPVDDVVTITHAVE